LNILTTSLAERGAEIYSTLVIDSGKSFVTPDLSPNKKLLSVDYVNRILGTKLNKKNVVNCLLKMGFDAEEASGNKIKVLVPAWRTDILHEIDLVEDVAVGYGFDRFEIDFPKAMTFGKALPFHSIDEGLRSIMVGLGFNEVTTFTISNEKDEFIKMGLKISEKVEIANPIGEEYSCLRVSLLPSLLKILRDNKHHSLPQQVFELGFAVDENAKNRKHLAGLKIDAKANFTECKSLIEAVLRDSDVKYNIKDKNHPAFIKGRCAAVMKNNIEIGFFGELHPKTIIPFELEHPVIGFEIQVDKLHQ
jgi:phenylalanyl-tRNA synthetase beta chain